MLAARELDSRQLRDALDQPRDLVAELGLHVGYVRLRVLDDIVQQGSRQRLLVEVKRGEDLRGSPRMADESLARATALTVMCARSA